MWVGLSGVGLNGVSLNGAAHGSGVWLKVAAQGGCSKVLLKMAAQECLLKGAAQGGGSEW